jgi:tyrosyl-tRNA synthetase
MSNVFAEFQWRGIVYDASPETEEALAAGPLTLYCGFDPTASTLHVGSLLPLMALARMQRAGHHPIALVGGGTGMIGDPSGKTAERQLLDTAQIEENLLGLREQIGRFLDFDVRTNPAQIVNNGEWLGEASFIGFLRDIGKHFTVNYMLAKESVRRRLENEDGISFTEFSYMLLQAYDYLVLHDRYGCTLQIGGSDQWGNIVAGTDLIRRLRAARAHALVMPLVTNARGTKFGKTESGTVWLDAGRTSPYRFYQFWLNTDDRDVLSYLRYFTWLVEDEVEELASEVEAHPERRAAQQRLAAEVTRLVHGDDQLERALRASSVLFGGDMTGMTAAEIEDIFEDVPSAEVPASVLGDGGIDIVSLLADSGLASSRGEARRLVRGGGVNVNNARVEDENERVDRSQAVDGRLLVLRRGQKTFRLVRIV